MNLLSVLICEMKVLNKKTLPICLLGSWKVNELSENFKVVFLEGTLLLVAADIICRMKCSREAG